MNLKKILALILALCFVLFTFVACDNERGGENWSDDECEHVFDAWKIAKNATCTADGRRKRVCTKCGYIDGEKISALGHSLVSGKCERCSYVSQTSGGMPSSTPDNSNNSNNIPTYGVGETWKENGQFELSLASVEDHGQCSSYLQENCGFSDEQVVLLTLKYKNTGYGDEFTPTVSSVTVIDEEGEQGRLYSYGRSSLGGCDHGVDPSACANGVTSRMVLPFALYNVSTSVTVIINIKDSRGVACQAKFTATVIPKVEAPEEDKLDGCTINLDESLPKIINYYNYSGKKESACSVTEVSFEVSGDNLNIYFSGRKTYDSRGTGQSDTCKIGWKLYDSNNNVIADGTAYTLSLSTGEGFLKAKDTAYDCIEAGGTYRLILLNVN